MLGQNNAELHDETKRRYLNRPELLSSREVPHTILPDHSAARPYCHFPTELSLLGLSDPTLTWFLPSPSNHLQPKLLLFYLCFSGFHPHLSSQSIQLDLYRKRTHRGSSQGMEGKEATIHAQIPPWIHYAGAGGSNSNVSFRKGYDSGSHNPTPSAERTAVLTPLPGWPYLLHWLQLWPTYPRHPKWYIALPQPLSPKLWTPKAFPDFDGP